MKKGGDETTPAFLSDLSSPTIVFSTNRIWDQIELMPFSYGIISIEISNRIEFLSKCIKRGWVAARNMDKSIFYAPVGRAGKKLLIMKGSFLHQHHINTEGGHISRPIKE